MSHMPDLDARRIYERIVGSRGHDDPGLFRTLMNNPELAERFAHFGELLRFAGVLRPDVRELAILCVARELRIAYSWERHQEFAAHAGLSPSVVAAVLAGDDLSLFEPLFPCVQELVAHFLRVGPIPQSLQDTLVAALSLAGFLELSVVIGYYKMTAGLAAGFEFPLPVGMSDPFQTRQGEVAAQRLSERQ